MYLLVNVFVRCKQQASFHAPCLPGVKIIISTLCFGGKGGIKENNPVSKGDK